MRANSKHYGRSSPDEAEAHAAANCSTGWHCLSAVFLRFTTGGVKNLGGIELFLRPVTISIWRRPFSRSCIEAPRQPLISKSDHDCTEIHLRRYRDEGNSD